MDSIIRGTTPTIIFTFTDFDPTEASKIIVSFSSGLEITQDDMDVTSNSISVWLSQRQTLDMSNNAESVQINFLYSDGQRAATRKKRIEWDENLHCEVMV